MPRGLPKGLPRGTVLRFEGYLLCRRHLFLRSRVHVVARKLVVSCITCEAERSATACVCVGVPFMVRDGGDSGLVGVTNYMT